MNKLMTMLAHYLAAAHSVIAQYGPSVWNATLQIVRIQSIFYLVTLIAATAASIFVAWKIHRFAQKKIETKQPYEEPELFYLFEIAPAAALVGCAAGWANSFVWWLGAFYPKIEILYSLAHKAGLL